MESPPSATATRQSGSFPQVAAHTTSPAGVCGATVGAHLRWSQGGAVVDQTSVPSCLARSSVGSKYSMGDRA